MLWDRKEGRKSKDKLLIRPFFGENMTIATIDIGGTGIKFASLTPDGKILDKTSIPTPENLEDLIAWLDQRLSEQDYSGIAMSVPGAVNQETGVIVFTIKRGESAVSSYLFAPPFSLCLLFEIKFLLF